MHSDPDAAPINPLPPAVMLLALAIVLPEIAFLAGSEGVAGGPGAVGWRIAAIERFGFSGLVFDYALGSGQWSGGALLRFVTYPFLHWGFTHMLMVVVFLLALGKMVGEVMGSLAVFAIFFGSAVMGAVAYALLTDAPQPLIGGYPAVYGLIGAFTFLLRARLTASGGSGARAFSLIGFLLGIQLLFGLLFGGGLDWIAEIAGFVTGFMLSFLLAPGGWTQTLRRLRRR